MQHVSKYIHTYIHTYPASAVHAPGDHTVSECGQVSPVESPVASVRIHTRYLAVVGHVQTAHLLEGVHRMNLHTYIHIHTYTYTYIHALQ